MRKFRRCTRILILSALVVSVLIPLCILSERLKLINLNASIEFVEDLSLIKYRTEAQSVIAVEEDERTGVKVPNLVVYKDEDFKSDVISNSHDRTNNSSDSLKSVGNVDFLGRNVTNFDQKEGYRESQEKKLPASGGKEKSNSTTIQHDRSVQHHPRRVLDEKLKEMKDQVIRARMYLNFAPAGSNMHLVKELKLRIKELERAIGESTKDSDLSKRALQKMKAMEASLLKASRLYPDCLAMVKKLRAMTYNAEEQVRAQKNQRTFLLQLAGRTTPKGLHCLSMRLTSEYFMLRSEERELPNHDKLHNSHLFHFALFSDNILASAVVINSTVSAAKEPEKIVFHMVTDSLNLPAMSMWFLLNPPGKAAIHVQSVENFDWLQEKYGVALQQQGSIDPRYTNGLNHLRFYLPDVFPFLNKVVLLDHDVVVQKDLTALWSIKMKGKVNGAVETCWEGEPSFRRMDKFINFTDSIVAKKFDANTCTWAFGMNVFDLQEWRKQDVTEIYHRYRRLGEERPVFKAGSLPIGWLTFYRRTVALDKRWQILGLGYDSGVRSGDIEQGAVIHFDGILKPWLDIGLEKYKQYWRRHINFDNPYLQQCNIHG